MAYSGYLIKIGGSNGNAFPFKYIKVDGYNVTPNQRMETEAKRAVTGLLHRSTVEHTASKIEIRTPYLTNLDVDDMMTIFRNAWTNTSERKLKIEYYDTFLSVFFFDDDFTFFLASSAFFFFSSASFLSFIT